jgi:hypothetical protein
MKVTVACDLTRLWFWRPDTAAILALKMSAAGVSLMFSWCDQLSPCCLHGCLRMRCGLLDKCGYYMYRCAAAFKNSAFSPRVVSCKQQSVRRERNFCMTFGCHRVWVVAEASRLQVDRQTSCNSECEARDARTDTQMRNSCCEKSNKTFAWVENILKLNRVRTG